MRLTRGRRLVAFVAVAVVAWLTIEVDAQFRHHTRIRHLPGDITGAGIEAYSALDLRVGWHVTPEWRIALVAQNLLDQEHVEFGTPATRGVLERAAWLKAEWRRE